MESYVYLQQESRAFWHKGEGYHRRDTRQCTDDHKYSPAVELVGRAHAETPSYEIRNSQHVEKKGVLYMRVCSFLEMQNDTFN